MMRPSEAAAVQRIVAEAFGDPVGVRDGEALAAALARPFAARNGIPVYPTFFNKLSAVLAGLLEARPFVGANRRTALCMLCLLLEDNGYRLAATARDVETLFHGVELGFTTWHRTSAWIKRHTQRASRGLPAG